MGWQVYMILVLLIVWGGTFWCVAKTMKAEKQ
ncbi:hypothetical protein Tlie_0725 [Thermovirga lienii DSM 17291]|jgi:hypothetical protein|uniref:MetS family NSS transporter small subunit n=1 Tax=Thermovirga lienii (strain ATCC BAA-1197 / DSM 17291 / Cas60314) TaxID=580340 RepID=G7V989_THELD|nr:hypothetical protein Tlie_0725 [Thermovirga lienii DSM 17291]